MEQILIHENYYEIERIKANINKGLLTCIEILFHLDTLDISEIESVRELDSLFKNPKGFFISKLPSIHAELFGLKVSPEKAFDLLDVDFKSILDLINKANKQNVDSFLEVGTLDENGFLQIDQQKMDDLLDSYRVFARTKEEIEFWTVYENVINGINTLIKMGANRIDFLSIPRNWLLNKQGSKYFEVNHLFFKRYRK
ncbi:MAG: hypothetical protein Q8T08_06815 [Ignavibacteria bacterium]|nr:hypothetical protein [Ignavibacteria bacterium]